MSKHDISETATPEVLAALEALRRAAQLARKVAIDTNTDLIVVRDGRTVHIPPAMLRREAEAEATRKPAR